MRNSDFKGGFTLIELLVAMVVTSFVLTAIATLAFALGSANKASGDINLKQAQVRFTTIKIQELIGKCKLICKFSEDDLSVWKSDNNYDGQINIDELVFIEYGQDRDHLQLCTFPSSNNSEIELSSIKAISTNWWSTYSNDIEYTRLLPECSNVNVSLDISPPKTRFLSISFEIKENDDIRQYQINSTLRSLAGNLLDEDGDITNDDD